MFQLSNEEIVIDISALGAELKSLRDKKTGTEYMWCADPAYWQRTSPILFPLVGNYKDKKMIYKHKSYPMSQHGFARDMEFEVVSRSADKIWLGISSNSETLKVYPFLFRLELGYRLKGRIVEVLWKVRNTGEETMYFSIGGHPAFNCPPEGMGKQTDCGLQFDAKERLISRRVGEDGLATDILDVYELDKGYLPLTEHIFQHDALVIEKEQAHRVSLVSPQGRSYVTVSFKAPLFGIWSPPEKNAPFICIEPWYGRCDHQNFDGELEDREWGNSLSAGNSFEASYQIEISEYV